ncbi:galactonate dehydratase [Candidatus Poribacteria bacterium]|nr:galactonate dehydratase [Candidatus Poribacteria bacterium]
MKITDLKVFPVRRFVYVKMVTDEGLHGIGEASLSGRSLAVVEALGHLKPLLVGQDATRIEHIWQDIFRGTFWRGGPVLQSALAGIDIALWDLAGKALGVPTYRLLGGATRDKVLVYRHVGGGTPEQLIENSQRLLAEGWRVLRISPIDGLEGGFNPKRAILRGVEHFRALRNAIGEEVEVIFEVHTRLTPTRAIELCNAIAEYRPFFVEDPIRSENPASFATLRAHTPVPIGTGEQLTTKWAFRELIEGELIDYLRVDICHSGGITEGKKIAVLGEVHYQELACHYTASPVSTAAMLHLNLSVPNCAVQEYAPSSGWINEVIQHDLRTEDGYLLCSDAPGLGIDLNEAAAAAYPHAPGEPPHLRREDGSVQDW